MPRIICPPRSEFDQLRTPLEEGERHVIDLFDRHLPDGWEIYIQPHLNGLRPDIVLLNPRVGIGVFEVKDWDPIAMDYHYEVHRQGKIDGEGPEPLLYADDRKGSGPFRYKDDPIEKTDLYRIQILELYCPRGGAVFAEQIGSQAILSAGAIFTKMTTLEANDLFKDKRAFLGHDQGEKAKYFLLVGSDLIKQGRIREIFPASNWSRSQWMTPQIAEDLRSWLVEPDISREQREPIDFDARQNHIIENREQVRMRRVKGPAGTGKTFVIAGRAARLAMDGKQILIVTYNVTLVNFIRDISVRFMPQTHSRKQIFAKIHLYNIHAFFRLAISEAGLDSEHRAIWRDYRENSCIEDDDDVGLSQVLEETIPALAERALEINPDFRFEAILVDEGQDLNLKWWNVLRKALTENGEMILVADQTQDLYGRSNAWTEEAMTGAGFRGNWFQFEKNYRLPPAILESLHLFAREFLTDRELDLPQPEEQGEFDLYPIRTWWRHSEELDIAQNAVETIVTLPKYAVRTLPFPDIYYLATSHNFGQQIAERLYALHFNVNHVFSSDRDGRRKRKLAFYKGSATVKGVTYHSFKGWEARALVLVVDGRIHHAEELFGLLYVGLTRLKRHVDGSYLVIVSSNPLFAEFGDRWNQVFGHLPESGADS